ncbi:hypothetical protein AMATHDRAFT_144507 [Amanita thiersii Skay4041]|uniref:Non-structural maintenance of chromosomes element 1 homolog n=1 Tax=Amanita thiersii Skay4041 TaxID=703135 RepID=A0A2A9NSJ3_9AGAR|nr:hypothetical protein AMATHDRAFT_144507 [Amanita thiersii Skay4041]
MVSASDVHRLFLHAILSRGVVSERLAKLLWKKCLEAVSAVDDAVVLPDGDDAEAWNEFVAKVNKSLDDLNLDFRQFRDEQTGTPTYALVNVKGDEIAQLATDYNPAEIAYFRALVEQIILAPRESFSISSLAALREVSAIKPKSNMTKTQAETVLASFVARGWLWKSKRGYYSLSTRSIVELGPYLKSTYPDDILECTACNQIMTRGVACPTSKCEIRMHTYCFTNFRRRHGGCPNCSLNWPQEPEKPLTPIGEDAAKVGDDARRRVRTRSAEMSDEEEPEASQSQSGSQRQSQSNQRVRIAENISMDMEGDGEDENENVRRPTRSQTRRRSSRR